MSRNRRRYYVIHHLMFYEIGIIADDITGRAGIRIEFPKIPAKTRRSDKPRADRR